MTDARELVAKLTVDDVRRLIDSYELEISSETDKEICMFQYDRYPKTEVFNHKAKLYWYSDTKIFKNYITNKAYDIYGFLMAMYEVNDMKLTFPDAIAIVERFATGEVRVSKWEAKLGKYKRKNYRPTFTEYNEEVLKRLIPAYPAEWLSAGISQEACDVFEIKEYNRLSQTVLPVRLDNKLIGVRVRNRDPELITDLGKYRPLQLLDGTSFSFSTNGTFYGWDQFKDDISNKGFVYLVEGEKSVLKSYSWFRHERPTLAMFGHSLSQWKRNLLLKAGVKTIYYVADCDFSTPEEKEVWRKNIKVWCQPLIAAGFKVYVVADWDLEYVGYKENAFDAKTPEIFNEICRKKELIA